MIVEALQLGRDMNNVCYLFVYLFIHHLTSKKDRWEVPEPPQREMEKVRRMIGAWAFYSSERVNNSFGSQVK